MVRLPLSSGPRSDTRACNWKMRALPDATDPEKCISDGWYYAYGDGSNPNGFEAADSARASSANVTRLVAQAEPAQGR